MFRPESELNHDDLWRRNRAQLGRSWWWQPISHTAGREFRQSLSTWPLRGAAILALVIAVSLIYCVVWFTGKVGVHVLPDPAGLPLQAIITIGYLIVMMGAALTQPGGKSILAEGGRQVAGRFIVRWIASRLLAYLMVYTLMLATLVPLILIAIWLGNFRISPTLLLSLLLSLFMAFQAITIALFVAVCSRTGEAASAVISCVIVSLLLLQISQPILANLPDTALYQFLIQAVQYGQRQLSSLSPFALSAALFDAALRTDYAALFHLVTASLLNGIFWLAASALVLKDRLS